jgi:predicted phosphodiesterase
MHISLNFTKHITDGIIGVMRYAILADIHSNLVAFQAVLCDIESRGGFDEIWCLGDIVGYGPEPHDCIKLLRQYKHVCVAGNHDWAAISNIDISDFNPIAAEAILWTRKQLNTEDVNYLQNLSLKIKKDDFTLVHGSPRHPIWEYLDVAWLSIDDIVDNFKQFDTRFCMVGHSHKPIIFQQDSSGRCFAANFPREMNLTSESNRLIINPGGVGQPRDGDPRASYAIYDSHVQVIYHYRVEYDITATQQKMMECNLPPPLIERLSYGY